MFADPNTEIGDIFRSPSPFYEIGRDHEPINKRDVFVHKPGGNPEIFGKYYTRMKELLAEAVDEIELGQTSVPQSQRLGFDAEAIPIRWFYHTIRSTVNFYASCQLRDRMLKLASKEARTAQDAAEAKTIYEKWRLVLLDEKANAEAAMPVMAADMRLDFYYGYSGGKSHSFFHGTDMIKAKLTVLENEINNFLPSLLQRCEAGKTVEPN
jgi:hypothetical protein